MKIELMKNSIFTIFVLTLGINLAFAQDTETSKEKNKWKFGLHFDNLNADQKAFNAETNGVVINRVSKDHPAEKAGVLVGDILTHIGDTAIKDQEHCIIVMRDFDTSKGSTILKIIRNGIKMDLKVVFKE